MNILNRLNLIIQTHSFLPKVAIRLFFFLKKAAIPATGYDKAIQLDPDDAVTYYNRGYSYAEIGEYQAAIGDYDKAIQLDPDDAMAYNNRAVALGKLGQRSLAEKDSNKACELDRSLC